MNGLELARKMAKYQYGGAWRGRFASEDAATARLAVMADAIGVEPADFGVTFRDVNSAWRIAPYASAYDRARSIVADADARAAADAIAADALAAMAADSGATDAATAARALAKDGRREDGQRMAAMGAMAARAVGQFVTAADAAPARGIGTAHGYSIGARIVTDGGRTGAIVGRGYPSARHGQTLRIGFDSGATYDVATSAVRLATDAAPDPYNVRPVDGGYVVGADPFVWTNREDAEATAADYRRGDRPTAADDANVEDVTAAVPRADLAAWRVTIGTQTRGFISASPHATIVGLRSIAVREGIIRRKGATLYDFRRVESPEIAATVGGFIRRASDAIAAYRRDVRQSPGGRAADAIGAFLTRASVAMVRDMLAATPTRVERFHSDTEDGYLWRVVMTHGASSSVMEDGWLDESAALYSAVLYGVAHDELTRADGARAAYLLGISDDDESDDGDTAPHGMYCFACTQDDHCGRCDCCADDGAEGCEDAPRDRGAFGARVDVACARAAHMAARDFTLSGDIEHDANVARDILADMLATSIPAFLAAVARMSAPESYGVSPYDGRAVLDILAADDDNVADGVAAWPIEELDLGVRAYNVVKRHGVDTFGDLLAITAEDANQWTHVGHVLGLPAARQIMAAQTHVAELLAAD